MNMILGEGEEVITVVEYDDDTFEEHVKVRFFTTARTFVGRDVCAYGCFVS